MSVSKKRPALSKAVLELKFMKRSKIRIEAEREAEASMTLFEKDITEAMKSNVGRFVVQESYIPIDDLQVGRMSFRGMNPEVEKYMAEQAAKSAKKMKMETDVTEEEMASFSLTIAKKFAKKRNKFKFEKPDSD